MEDPGTIDLAGSGRIGKRLNDLINRYPVAVQGSMWSIIGYGAGHSLRFVSTIVLARFLLNPADFGVVALVNIFVASLQMFSDLGVGVNVVQSRRGEDPVYLGTAFSVHIWRALAIWLLASAAALPFARFYGEPALGAYILVAAVGGLLRSLVSPKVWLLNRRVQVRNLTFLTLGGEVAGFLVAVAWAWKNPSAWALVMGALANATFYGATSYLIRGPSIVPKWDSEAAREIFAFGSGIMLSSGTFFLALHSERLILGKFINPEQLGNFSLALTIASVPFYASTRMLTEVVLPLASLAAREDAERLSRKLRKTRFVLVCGTLGISTFFIIFGKHVVRLLLGARYAPAGAMLQMLGFRAALELYGMAASTLLLAAGVSKYGALGNTLRLVVLAVGLGVAFSVNGFDQALWVLTLAPLAMFIPLIVGLKKQFALAPSEELKGLGAFLAGSALVALLVRYL